MTECLHRCTGNIAGSYDVHCSNCGEFLYNVLDTLTEDERARVAENNALVAARLEQESA